MDSGRANPPHPSTDGWKRHPHNDPDEPNEADEENGPYYTDSHDPDIEPEDQTSPVDGEAPACEEPTDFDQFYYVIIV